MSSGHVACHLSDSSAGLMTGRMMTDAEVMYGMIGGHEVTMIEGGIWKNRLTIQLEVKIYMFLMGALQMQI